MDNNLEEVGVKEPEDEPGFDQLASPAIDPDIPWRGMTLPPLSEPPVTGVLHGGDGDWQGNGRLWNQEDPQDSFNAAFGGTVSGDDDTVSEKGEAVSEAGGEAEETALVLGVKLSQYGPVYFFQAGQEKLKSGSQVLVDAEQGVSLAEVVIARRLRLPLPKIRTEEGQEVEILPIRGLAGPADIAAAADNRILAASARLYCKECIRARNLDMKLVDVEVLHDRSKIIFYFTAPTRIDFRELVKDLVRNYHTRIELRQIGVRHETQMIGALGNCGMTCCCRRYLRKFAPVTIKMAKEQNLFLNPAKLSGICGRLLCCLSYEQANYEEFHKRSPKMGKKYRTSQGVVKVLRANLFRQSLFIQGESGEETELQLEDWEALQPVRQEQGGPDSLDRASESAPEIPGNESGQTASFMPSVSAGLTGLSASAAPEEPVDAPKPAGPVRPNKSEARAEQVKADPIKALPGATSKALPPAPSVKSLPMMAVDAAGAVSLPEAEGFVSGEAMDNTVDEAMDGGDGSIFGLPGLKYSGQPDNQNNTKTGKSGHQRGRWRKRNKR